MFLLTELIRLDVSLSAGQEGLEVDAPAGVLTEELRRALREHKVALLRYAAFPYVETMDGIGILTGNRRGFSIIDFVAPERRERLRYKIGVRLLQNGVEQFYLPGIVWGLEREDLPQ